ncbi:hypothetical protein FB451DRAFT_1300929 [Mycena latifolia]|nr:hypothetical protein FB451DRAFT_1300929 [Mycena latifolia]
MTRDKLARAISLNTEHTGLAPLYIMCGGAVRPQLTRVNEAYEMKAYAVEKYGIPAEQILVDATSEHTYSNFMNAVLIARDAGMPRGTRLGVFMVPDRYGMDDQYAFCVNRLWARAKIEVFPPLGAYFSLEDGEEERAVELVLNTGPEDAEPEFVSPTLLWRDYTGELRAEG